MAHLGGQVESATNAVAPYSNIHVDTSGTPIGGAEVAARELEWPLQVCARLDDVRLRHPRFVVDDVPPSGLTEFLRFAQGQPVVVSRLNAGEWTGQVLPLLNSGHDLRRVLVDLWSTNRPLDPIERRENASRHQVT